MYSGPKEVPVTLLYQCLSPSLEDHEIGLVISTNYCYCHCKGVFVGVGAEWVSHQTRDPNRYTGVSDRRLGGSLRHSIVNNKLLREVE